MLLCAVGFCWELKLDVPGQQPSKKKLDRNKRLHESREAHTMHWIESSSLPETPKTKPAASREAEQEQKLEELTKRLAAYISETFTDPFGMSGTAAAYVVRF